MMAATNNSFQWTEEQETILKNRYQIDGPTKLSKDMNIPYWVLLSKAKRLGIGATRKTPPKGFKWTEVMLLAIKKRYVNEGGQILSEEFGCTLDMVRRKASDMNLHTTAGHARWGRERAEASTSCDIHYFDKWSPNMAYILGFLFADGSIAKDLTMVVVNVTETDTSVLRFIKKELKSKHKIRRVGGRPTGCGTNICKPQSNLNISSKVLVAKLVSLGMKPRKTFNDDPFPDVPDDMLPHFVRGYLDGDGSISISSKDVCSVSFVGSPKFITKLRDLLVQVVGIKCKPVHTQQGITASWSTVCWGGITDIRLLCKFMYPSGFDFCFKRKKANLDRWLSIPRTANDRRYFTTEEEDQIRNLYHLIGPTKLANMMDRTRFVIHNKVKQLGLELFNKRRFLL